MNKTVNVEIQLRGDLILRLPECGHYLRLRGENLSDRIQMTLDFLQATTGVFGPSKDEFVDDLSFFRDYLIKILEEKFGVKIRDCVNCGHLRFCGPGYYCEVFHHWEKNFSIFREDKKSCDKWVLRETKKIPEYGSEEKK